MNFKFGYFFYNRCQAINSISRFNGVSNASSERTSSVLYVSASDEGIELDG